MGLFDRVWIPCKKCQQPLEFQSKAGRCVLSDYDMGNMPIEIAIDINGDSAWCEDCQEGTTFRYGEKIETIADFDKMELE